ncbi:ATP-binding protein [Streptomyces europaeiscabiei]|uniref:ATP-binding protein n=1 Tax=Streptomyces TaxID=1883 RepID=UPI0006284F9B|nr:MULTISPECIES: ATP-binding protein [Streptomyces]
MRIPIEVKPDFIEHVARRSDPVGAVAELIWNGLDADATTVAVSVEGDEFGGVRAVEVRDNGHGIPSEAVPSAFSGMGGSWKRNALGTQGGRQLHGRRGYGRFRVLALGSQAVWETVADGTVDRHRTSVAFSELSAFETTDGGKTSDDLCTVVRIIGEAPRKTRLTDTAAVRSALTNQFAMYLEKYPRVAITWQDVALNPKEAIELEAAYPLSVPGLRQEADASAGPVLRVVEWKTKPARRELLVCDAEGVHRATLNTAVQAPDFHFTAYILWTGAAMVSELDTMEGEWEHPDSPLGLVVAAARDQMRRHFKKREHERALEQVQKWIDEQTYPYSGEPGTATEAAERQVFNEVAVLVSRHINQASKKSRHTQLVLLREALRRQPAAMPRVMDELFALTTEQKDRLESLVNRAGLSNLIAANALLVDRIDTLATIRKLLFEYVSRAALREKDQLHRMLEKQLWIFGDEYTSAVSEVGLTEALERHRHLLDGSRVPRSRRTPAVRSNGQSGRLDLMLSCVGGDGSSNRHLVVELKRPNVVLGPTEVQQVTSYARAVIMDERYKHDKSTRWDFWLVGNDIHPDVEWQVAGNSLPEDCLVDDGRVGIWVIRWGKVIDQCEARLRAQQSRLDYASSNADVIDYAERMHADADIVPLLPPA